MVVDMRSRQHASKSAVAVSVVVEYFAAAADCASANIYLWIVIVLPSRG